ncbi:hypothetical protein [Pseudalkalibacillus salsuginis]|uniref:hypothetical protein n=1 Tax=Pseudalkalibacillus salsuginis TaxID=2910972 RepID=UPI001F3A6EEA|nr:hypothetical protein [Pseudalkalibacillus salsuginis]MCF6411063.1 hypothetical protein [Pseudalkalibacillus salsuginis]
MTSLRQERKKLNKQDSHGPQWFKFASIFFIGYGIVYLIVFFKRLFFSDLTIDSIASLYLYDLESSYIFSIIAGTIVFMFLYAKLRLWQKERLLFDQLPNLFMIRMILYICIYFMVILTLLGIHLIFSTLFVQQTGGSLNLSYSLFYWAVVVLLYERLKNFFAIEKKSMKRLIFVPFIVFYVAVLIFFKFQTSYQLVFQFIGNGLVLLMFGLYLVEKHLKRRKKVQTEKEE